MKHKKNCPAGDPNFVCETCKSFVAAMSCAITEEEVAEVGQAFAEEVCTCNDCLCDFLNDDGEFQLS